MPIYEDKKINQDQLLELRKCKQCGMIRQVKRKSAIRDLCPSCANKNRRTSRNLLPNEKSILKHLYWGMNLSMNQIGKMYGVGPGIVDAKLKELNIKTRTRQEGKIISGTRMKGKNNPNYKSGRTQNGKDGYVFILKPEHPRAHQGYVPEHILVWEETHNKFLPEDWVIHHLNGVKNDNRPENLAAMPNRKHKILIPTLKGRVRELEARLSCR